MSTSALKNYCFSVKSTLVKGDQSPRVEALCRLLIASNRGFKPAVLRPKGVAGDVFTPAIESVVKQFQRQTFLRPHGIVSPHTWQALCENAPVHMPILRLGDHALATHTAQHSLKDLGFYNAPIDGYFGPETYEAILEFQMTFGLVQRGLLDMPTWDKLGRASVVSLPMIRG